MGKLESVKPESDFFAYYKIMNWFFSYPQDEFTLNDLCKQLKISKTTAHETVKRFIDEKFLTLRILGKLWRIQVNQSHSYFVIEKIPYNLRLVYQSGILTEVNRLYPSNLSVTLFGSYRKGDDIPESDVDIAVEILGNEPIKIIEIGTLKQFGYRENVKVSLHVFSRNKIDLNVFANIANGIVLQGFLEVRP